MNVSRLPKFRELTIIVRDISSDMQLPFDKRREVPAGINNRGNIFMANAVFILNFVMRATNYELDYSQLVPNSVYPVVVHRVIADR